MRTPQKPKSYNIMNRGKPPTAGQARKARNKRAMQKFDGEATKAINKRLKQGVK